MKSGNHSSPPPLFLRWNYFLMFFLLLLTNLSSLSVFNVSFPPLRYLRQPSLVLVIMALFHFFPSRKTKPGFRLAVWIYYFFCLNMAFNSLTSISMANTALYSAWTLGFFFFFYHFLVLRNELDFRDLLFQFSAAAGMIGGIFIVFSYLGGYVLGIDTFFDERYNYTLMRMTTEFAGIFGSNNSLGILTFLTFAFLLLLFELTRGQRGSVLFMGGAIFHSLLLFQIGNRASMGCGVFLWLLYFLWVYRSLAGTLVLTLALVLGSIAFQETLVQKLRLEQFEGGNLLGNRSALIEEAMQVVDEMDFFGVGYHNQKLSRKHFRLVGDDDKDYNFHNTYLAVLIELGFLGLIWIPGIVLIFLFRTSWYPKPAEEKRLIRFIKGLILVMMLFYLPVEDSINSPGSPTFILFWTLFFILGIGLAERPLPKETEPHEKAHRLSDNPVPGS